MLYSPSAAPARQLKGQHEPRTTAAVSAEYSGAGDGNRTHVTSLEGWGSTIELHPLDLKSPAPCVARARAARVVEGVGFEPT